MKKIFRRVNKEIPYVVEFKVTSWLELPNGVLKLSVNIIVPKKTQIPILIGKNGSGILSIQTESIRDLASYFKKEVKLHIDIVEKK